MFSQPRTRIRGHVRSQKIDQPKSPGNCAAKRFDQARDLFLRGLNLALNRKGSFTPALDALRWNGPDLDPASQLDQYSFGARAAGSGERSGKHKNLDSSHGKMILWLNRFGRDWNPQASTPNSCRKPFHSFAYRME